MNKTEELIDKMNERLLYGSPENREEKKMEPNNAINQKLIWDSWRAFWTNRKPNQRKKRKKLRQMRGCGYLKGGKTK